MGILNYSTEISVEKTIEHIYKALITHGAFEISYDHGKYDSEAGLRFKIDTLEGYKDFVIQVNINAAYEILKQQRASGIIKINVTESRAERVAWRIVMRWIDAQLAIIETGMVKFEEAFFAFMDNGQGQRMFSVYERKQLPSGS